MDTIVGAIAGVVRAVPADIVAAWTDSPRSFLGPTSQLWLIGQLGVFLSLAFQPDHIYSAQRLASGLSFLVLLARYQVPSSFNSTPGYPNFLARRWR